MSDKMDEMGAGAVAGFQLPMGIERRKNKVSEMLRQNPDITMEIAQAYFSGLKEDVLERHGTSLDAGGLGEVAEAIRHHYVREMVRRRVKEVVRKKAGGGGYVLYTPNPKKKGPSKAVGNFPTKLDAKRAELARFPPKQPGKLARLRHDVDKLMKDPKKRAEAEKKASKEKGTASVPKKSSPVKTESTRSETLLRGTIRYLVGEALFREEQEDSHWDDYVGRLPPTVLAHDKRVQKLQKNIEDRSKAVLEDALKSIQKALGKNGKVKSFGVKRDAQEGRTYLAFSVTLGEVSVEPIYIYIEHGVPKIEVSENAKNALTKADPDDAKMFRYELVTVQERVLDSDDAVSQATAARDKYLTKLEDEIDKYVAALSPLEVSLMKGLLTKKYRKLS